MKAFYKHFLALSVLLAAALPLGAADYVFALRADATTAAVYDTAGLQLVANPPVGFGASQVLGLPGTDFTSGFEKFFVVGRDSVVVLDGDFQVRRTVALNESASPGPGTAVLAAGGTRLLVATGREIVVISTAEERVLTSVALDFGVRALAALPGTARVYVLGEDSRLLQQLDLETYQLEDGVARTPQALSGVAAAPSGGWIYGVAGNSFYNLRAVSGSQVPASQAGPQLASADSARQTANPAAAPRAVTVADNGRYAMVSGGRVYKGWLSGPPQTTAVTVSNDGVTAPLAASSIALSADGQQLFAASSDGPTLLKIELNGSEAPQTVALSAEPSEIALVSPNVGQAAGMLAQVSPPALTVAGGKEFSLKVKAVDAGGAAQSNITVFASGFDPSQPTVDCYPNVTGSDGTTTLSCTAGEVTATALVRVTLSDTTGRSAPSFQVTVVKPTATEGLVKKSGDFAVVPENSEFQLTVTASLNRVPQDDLTLTVSSVPSRPAVICPAQITTDANGEATVTCKSGVVAQPDAPKIAVGGDDHAQRRLAVGGLQRHHRPQPDAAGGPGDRFRR